MRKKKTIATLAVASALALATTAFAGDVKTSFDMSDMNMEMPSQNVSLGKIDAGSLNDMSIDMSKIDSKSLDLGDAKLDAESLGDAKLDSKSLDVGDAKLDSKSLDLGDSNLDVGDAKLDSKSIDSKLDSKSLDLGDAKLDAQSLDSDGLEIDSKSLDAGDAKLDSKSLDAGDAKLDSKSLDGEETSLEATSLKSEGSSDSKKSGNWGFDSVNMDSLQAEMPTLDGFSTDVDVSSFMPKTENSKLEMPDLNEMRSEMSESMKSNAMTTLTDTFGTSFTNLDSDLFGAKNMPDVSFESLNVEYASMIDDFKSQGFGSKFEFGELPQSDSTKSIVSKLDSTVAGMNVSSDSDYASLKNGLAAQGYGRSYELTTPTTGKESRFKNASNAKDVFNANYSGLGSGVQEMSIPSNFNPSAQALYKTRTNRGNAYGEFRGTDAYKGYQAQASTKHSSLDAKSKMETEYKKNKPKADKYWRKG